MSEVLAIVLNWNAYERTARCLESVIASVDVTVDFVAVDNGSEDGSGALLAGRFGDEHVIRLPENTGYAGGMNAGVEHWLTRTRAPFALIATEDMSFDARAVAQLVRALRERPAAGIAGPAIYHRGEEARLFCAGGVFERSTATARLLRRRLSDQVYAADWVDGCFMLLRREAIEAAGAFDRRFFIYFEEADLCHRVRQKGWEVVVVPYVAAQQEKPAVPSPRYFYYMARNRFLFWRKNFGIGTARVATLTVLDTLRMAAWTAVSLLVPRLWPEAPRRMRWLSRQLRGGTRGTLAHLRGQYGR